MSIRHDEAEDLRVRRTRAHLRRALAELLGQHQFREITVTQLCAAALVHRTTFYKHYADKEALFDDLLSDRINEVLTATGLPAGHLVPAPGQPVERLAGFLDRMRADPTLFLLLADADLSPASTQRLTRELVQQLKARAPRAGSRAAAASADLMAHLHGAVLTAALVWWARTTDNVPAERVAHTVWQILKPADVPVLG
ncbi:TetR/AcrR family transcriptional regulator [Granulicoccus phenolivorans]|uniref:TetR/AcrR family transcriptional regulator n=1 Tax=Granulicoccus phenolivorans TaxID=266854 RepID=UPI0004185FDF|nr:TetR/AcrR family transcriptional regulator [Granulicoccus phenolivorans]